MMSYIFVGFQDHNYVFEVFTDREILKPKIEWQGKVHVIKSYEEALSIIFLESLPF